MLKRTWTAADLARYAARLRELPFVRSLRVLPRGVLISTPDEKFELTLDLRKSHLGREGGEAVIARHQRAEGGVLVAAPLIGAELGRRLEAAGINFIDADGNCYLNLDDRFIARVQRAARPSRETGAGGIRAPGYQVLFGLLAEDELRLSTVRVLAKATGVSVAPAHQMRGRLVDMGLASRRHDGLFFWFPDRWDDALGMFIAGYGTTLRRRLLLGRFRTPYGEPSAVERRVEEIFGSGRDWAFGGGSAAQRIAGHYHGPHVTVHVLDAAPEKLRALKAVPDREGPLILLRSPGEVGLRGPLPHVAHPLLVYAELLYEGGERAREAANEVLERFGKPT